MNKKISVVILVTCILIAALIIGCTTPVSQNQNTFLLGKEFTAKPGVLYLGGSNDSSSDVQITVLSIADSRCPTDEGIVCVWAGELGVNFKFGNYFECPTGALCKPSPPLTEVYLGLTTKNNIDLLGFNIKLLSVNPDKNEVVLIVKTLTTTDEREWFSIEPKQCMSNPWDTWEAEKISELSESGILIEKADNAGPVIRAWLTEVFNIQTFDSVVKRVSYDICNSCSCSTGEMVAVLVNASDSQKLISLGFTKMSPIACTLEAKICSDGSAVGRTAPFCEFSACPVDNENLLIVKTNVPGFVINPITITTTINSNGSFTLNKTQSTWNQATETYDTNESSTNGTLTTEQLDSLRSAINSLNFFLITEEDARACIADNSSINIEVTLGNKHNIVNGLNQECDRNATVSAREISDLIESYIPITSS